MSVAPVPAPSPASSERANVQRGLDAAQSFWAHHGYTPADGAGSVRFHVGPPSHYNALTKAISITHGDARDPMEAIRAAAHEYGHHVSYEQAGLGGLFYAGQPGATAEAIAEMAAAGTCDFVATTPSEHAAALEMLNPAGKTGYAGWRLKTQPLPRQMSDLRPMTYDLGGVHFTRWVPMNAVYHLAQQVGMEDAMNLLAGAVRGMDRITPFEELAERFVAAADTLPADRRDVVRAAAVDAFRGVGLLQAATAPAARDNLTG